MKIAEVNIGLSSKSLGEITADKALYELVYYGFKIITHRLQDSVSNDGTETCLAVKVELPERWQSCLAEVADNLGQDCIAVVGFIGHAPYDTFCADLWVSPETDEIETHLDALEIADETESLPALEFIAFLEEILIPDLYESGNNATADDFRTLIRHYRAK